jgi:hypothetical protein
MTNFSTNLIAIAILGFSTFNSNQMSKYHPEELNLYPNYLLLYYRSFLTPVLVTFLMILYVLKKKEFRSYLKMLFNRS